MLYIIVISTLHVCTVSCCVLVEIKFPGHCYHLSIHILHTTVETTHTITNVMDVSDSCVELEVTATSDPSVCFEEYIFSAVGVGNSATANSSSSTVFTGMVCGLCSPYCGYNYTVVGRPKYGEDVVAFKTSGTVHIKVPITVTLCT